MSTRKDVPVLHRGMMCSRNKLNGPGLCESCQDRCESRKMGLCFACDRRPGIDYVVAISQRNDYVLACWEGTRFNRNFIGNDDIVQYPVKAESEEEAEFRALDIHASLARRGGQDGAGYAALGRVEKEVLTLSSGTLATLTGHAKYDTLERVRACFAQFARLHPEYPTWQDAWNAFDAAAKANNDPYDGIHDGCYDE